MASQTSDTANGPLTLPAAAGLPADPLPLLLKVIPVVPSPPRGCGTAPDASMPHPTSCSRRCCPGSQLRPWGGSGGASFSTALSACRRSRPNQAGIHQPTLLPGFLARTHPTFHLYLVFFQLGGALWHGQGSLC